MATNALNNDFLLNIQSVYPSLTKAEKKVADYTLQNSKAVRFLSITDLAEACHVSLTSVFRFCKVLKLQGYQEFKVQLALSIQEEGQDEEIELLPAAVTKADSVLAVRCLPLWRECINSCTLCQTFTACPISTCRQWAPPR